MKLAALALCFQLGKLDEMVLKAVGLRNIGEDMLLQQLEMSKCWRRCFGVVGLWVADEAKKFFGEANGPDLSFKGCFCKDHVFITFSACRWSTSAPPTMHF